MYKWLKTQVEIKLGSEVDTKELFKAIDMAKDDVVSNGLVIGQDVTAKNFVEVVARCINIIRKTDRPVGISQAPQIRPECGCRLVHEGGCSVCMNCGK